MNADEIKELTLKARDYALQNGLIIRSLNTPTESLHAPFTLFPSPYPAHCFHRAKTLQPLFNALIDKLSLDTQFITTVMQE